ncbi:MAG: TolC family protein [Phycisphaerae bacterium]
MVLALKKPTIALVLLVFVAGCVDPGELSMDTLNKYQRSLWRRGPQDRVAGEGLAFLEPADDPKLPELKIHKRAEQRPYVKLDLDSAILRTLWHNLDIRVISYDPAIARQDMIRAASAFDVLLNAGFSYTNTNRQPNSVIGGESETREFNVGLSQRLVTGTTWSLAWTQTRTWDGGGFSLLNTAYEPEVSLSVTQPLLRNAWPEFNLAELRIARLNRDISEQQFRQQVEDTINEVVNVYWQLIQARRDLAIQKRLLQLTETTFERVKARKEVDVTDVEIGQTKAALEGRRATMVRVVKRIFDLEDRVKRLLADPTLNVTSNVEIVPTTDLTQTLVSFDQGDQLLTALKYNPQLEQLRTAIAIAGVNVEVAKNQLLPQLDLTVTGGYQGLGSSRQRGYENLGSLDYFSSSIALSFEYPIGNRLREAELRRARLERLRAITELQSAADEVAIAVKERLREIQAAWQEYQAQKLAAAAAQMQVTALQEREENVAKLTPEFLQVKLAAQETLAAAERAVIQSLVAYNVAIVDLRRVTGTVTEMPRVKIAMPLATRREPLPISLPEVDMTEPETQPAEK